MVAEEIWDERYAMTPCERADSDKEDVKYGF
jgi:hypothetical protein